MDFDENSFDEALFNIDQKLRDGKLEEANIDMLTLITRNLFEIQRHLHDMKLLMFDKGDKQNG